MHPSYGWSLVCPSLQAFVQRHEILLEVRRVLLRRLAVDSDSSILARASMSLVQEPEVNVIGQGGEHHPRCFLCQLRYSMKSR